ncbi:hypothetical protein [Natrinema hispanicum]|uniref:Uncharacterized protein n=1 Tax=Natrinema hispanicum TaxID=392421 RepID=A0A1I0IXJ3_9EURY|nr:hypothetical protein [Natrinema hispanicum]SEU01405.1 hypothetical protein SAMN04488694_12654 [Natrinema hispanicum]
MSQDGLSLSWAPPNARRRRITFEPWPSEGWERIEEEQHGDEWQIVSREIVTDVDLEAPAAIMQGSQSWLGP